MHEGESVDITERCIPPPKVWSQMPPETVLEVENLKSFLGEHTPRPPYLMTTIMSLSYKQSCRSITIVLVPLSLGKGRICPPLTKILNESLYCFSCKVL